MQSWNSDDEETQSSGQFYTGSPGNVDQNNILGQIYWDYSTSQPSHHSNSSLNGLNSAAGDPGFQSPIETPIDLGFGFDEYPNTFHATTEADPNLPLNH